MTSYDDFDDARVQHLVLIQSVISRLGTNGFLMKGWSVTIAAAIIGFAVESQSWLLGLVAIPATIALWALDAYFLRCERLFRELYRRVSEKDSAVAPFFMAATGPAFLKIARGQVGGFWSVFLSPTLNYFYLPIVGTTLLIVVLIALAASK